MTALCTPVRGTVHAEPAAGPATLLSLEVSADEPVFRGHYPAFPIFPGVCLVEFVRLGALAAHAGPDRAWRMAEVRTARFTDPVRPGDHLTAALAWQREADAWLCRATVSTRRGVAAKVTLVLEEVAT
ncbi:MULTISPECIES: ApeI family dehydratase [unclassified Streptomyces]|uniref:ApeI family dehydratase n=1 Tax=Streptomyces sp. NPDC094466 TaxID=3366065 RepID=UPI0037F1A450